MTPSVPQSVSVRTSSEAFSSTRRRHSQRYEVLEPRRLEMVVQVLRLSKGGGAEAEWAEREEGDGMERVGGLEAIAL